MQADRDGARITGAMLVIIAAGLWATVGVAVKWVPGAANLSPEALGLARTLLAGPLILALAGHARGTLRHVLSRIDRGQLFGFAVAGVIFQICLFRSFDLLGVTLTVFLTVCLPPVIATLWSVSRGLAIGRGALVALALAVVGLGLCAFGHTAIASDSARTEGLGLALLASIAFVWMSDAARSLSRAAPPMLVAGLGLTLSGVVFCLILPFAAGQAQPLWHGLVTDPQVVALVIYLAAIPTALAYVCYCAGMARCRSTAVGLTASMIEPAIAALLALVLLNERLGAAELAGCLLLAVAMIVLMRSESAGLPRPPHPGTAVPSRP